MYIVRSTITASGQYLPSREVSNAELTMFPARSLPLIEEKTGIKARRYAADHEVTSDLAAEAARDCLKRAKLGPETIDAIILATSSPDRILSATAARTQHLLGAVNAFAFDINSVCSGALFALDIADAWIRLGRCRRVLVIAAEIYSRFLNPKDFSTYPYFGDGAGALLLEASTDEQKGIWGTLLYTDGSGFDTIRVPAGGTACPFNQMRRDSDIYFAMNGREVFEFAVRRGSEVILQLIADAGISLGAVRWVVTHQANINIVNEISKKTGIARDRFFVNLQLLGNTAGASVLIAYHQLRQSEVLNSGEIVVLAAFGGGLSWGATLMHV